jgi:hypothetical protein
VGRSGASTFDFSFSIGCADVEQITFTRCFRYKLAVLNFMKIYIDGIVVTVYVGELICFPVYARKACGLVEVQLHRFGLHVV